MINVLYMMDENMQVADIWWSQYSIQKNDLWLCESTDAFKVRLNDTITRVSHSVLI